MEELTYTRVVDEKMEQNVFYGKYASLRRDYLKKHRPTLWAAWVNRGKLTDHLKEIEQAADGYDSAASDESCWCDRRTESP